MRLLRFFKNFLSAYLGIVLLLMAIFTIFVGYQFRRNYALGDILFFVIIFVIAILLFVLIKKTKDRWPKFWAYIHTDKCFKKVLIFGSIALLAIQIFIAAGGWFIAGWDTRDVIFPEKQMNSDYMSMYPNQLFLAGLFRRIYFFVSNVFALDFYAYYFTLVVLSVLCVFTSVVLISLVAKKIASPIVATVTFLCAASFIGLMPWIMIPYSDTFAMLFTTLTLFWYCFVKNKPAKWFLIFFTSFIGLAIKPTAIFILIAILIVEVCLAVSNFKKIINNINKLKIIKAMVCVLVALLGFGFGSVVCGKISSYGVQIDSNRSFTATHFLMMGINLENHGGWNEDDVGITRSYSNVEEREAGNIRQWEHRLLTYGLSDIAFIFLNKTLTIFNDGSFAWEAEKPWMIENRGDNPIVLALFGIDTPDTLDDNNVAFAYPRQIIWLMILIGCAFSFLNKKPKKEEFVVYLSILAISAFLTLFEPDPRYLLLYAPYFVLIAPKGWAFAHQRFLSWQSNSKTNNIISRKENYGVY